MFSTGKVIIEEEMKEEMKEDVDPHSGADDGRCLHPFPGTTYSPEQPLSAVCLTQAYMWE